MVTLLGHEEWNFVISHFSRIFCPNCAACQHSLIYVQECQYQENVEWQSLSQIFPAIQVSEDLIWVMYVSLLLSGTTVFVLITFFNCWTVEILHWFQRIYIGFNRSKVTCSTFVIHRKPGGTHTYILYDYAPLPNHPPTPDHLYSLDLHDPISNLFRLGESSPNVHLVHILHSREDSSASLGELLYQSLLSTSVGRWFSTSVFGSFFIFISTSNMNWIMLYFCW